MPGLASIRTALRSSHRDGRAEEYGLKPKSDVARDIADKIEKYLDR
ncbi:MAG: hypothetical protein ACLTZY_10835 [Alistipes indistinctus]